MADQSTNPNETVLFDRGAQTASVSVTPTVNPSVSSALTASQFSNEPTAPIPPPVSFPSGQPTSTYSNQQLVTSPDLAPVVATVATSSEMQNTGESDLALEDQTSVSKVEAVVPSGATLESSEVVVLHQPKALLVIRILGLGIFYYFSLRLLQKLLMFMVDHFPELAPNFVTVTFLDSTLFFWGTILFILIAIGIGLKWWFIFFQISPSEVIVNSGIIIKKSQVLKRVGISIRQIEIKRNLLGQIFNYVTIEIGSEVLGGVSMTISDKQNSLDTITSALKPGEIIQTKKIW